MNEKAQTIWSLDPTIWHLNHGSFGACPRAVLDAQTRLRALLESAPTRFIANELKPRWEQARAAMAEFVGVSAEDLVFVPNVTTGVNTVLRSLRFQPGDELLTTSHAYAACLNALRFVARQSGAQVVVAPVPFPLETEAQVTEAVLSRLTPRTRLLLIDHVTSPTGLLFPLKKIVPEAEARGVRVLVDGAHAPGMIPLAVEALGASYYTGNAHKWLCAPKGAAFLHVRRDRQPEIRPLVIGLDTALSEGSRFRDGFDWTGTTDPSAFLVIPEAIQVLGSLFPGGWPELWARNRALALKARQRLGAALGIDAPSPDSMVGALASLPLPPGEPHQGPFAPLQERLFEGWRLDLPVFAWPAPPHRVLRFSAQAYVDDSALDRVEEALTTLGLCAA